MSSAELRATARLLARLLLREVDADLVASLGEPETRDALAALGLALPAASDDAAGDALDQLAAEYFAHFVNPAGAPPPVQSLAEGGTYEGDAATGVRQVAEAAGVSFDAEEARGAPPDHLGCELLLWDELAGRDPAAAAEFARRHLAWAPSHLRGRAGAAGPSTDGFYDRLASVTADFVDEVLTESNAASA